MGILTLLRNAFGGRSRKGAATEAEGAETTPSQETEPKLPSPAPEPAPAAATVPEPRTSTDLTDSEHELVAAAFDKVAVPKQTPPAETPEPTTPNEKPAPETPVAEETAAETPVAEPVIAEEPAAETPVAEEPTPVAEPVVAEEPVAEAPAAAEEATPEPTAVAETQAEEPVAETPVAEETAVEAPTPVTAEDEKAPTAEVAAEPEPEPEPVAEAVEPEPEVEVAPEPEPTDEAEPVVAVADGEDAPQGPPAVDDESGTGGAGGNDDPAEGRSMTVPDTLRTAYAAAATTLETHHLTGTTARTYLVLDRSASMRPYYKDGSAQALGEQTLALAAHLDPESKVHVVFFSTELDGTGELTLTEHENKIDELHAGLGRMGRTSYHAAVEEVLAHHTKESPDTPALVVFQTDGAPDAKTPATQALTEAAKTHPGVFFSFVAFGDPENKAFDYLRKLKLTNTSHFLAGETPKELTDAEIYEGILANWRP
ncbi:MULTISPECIES: VWA domain-containing protein [Streptomyces]|uniref:Toxic cation resistance protein n=1 Tax=Streptomyces pseudovenezuelae TaxID=67350 RepID=A0A101N3I7_9ACTN|nr:MULTISPECIES: VWA domain-containing protein [Streptomyces]KUM85876.1 Toxic cation resistance protein [Streptomyces pseudovenezuelae]